jgi:hypothetical protein
MPNTGLICSHCNDVADVVTPLNGSTLLAGTMTGERQSSLSTHCVREPGLKRTTVNDSCL